MLNIRGSMRTHCKASSCPASALQCGLTNEIASTCVESSPADKLTACSGQVSSSRTIRRRSSAHLEMQQVAELLAASCARLDSKIDDRLDDEAVRQTRSLKVGRLVSLLCTVSRSGK